MQLLLHRQSFREFIPALKVFDEYAQTLSEAPSREQRVADIDNQPDHNSQKYVV